MTPDIVVDIGNSRIKWGWCKDGRVECVSVLGDDVAEWNREIGDRGKTKWAIASVHPGRSQQLLNWIESRSEASVVLDSFTQIPILTVVKNPFTIGIDRLCASLAAVRLHGPGPMLVVQVGTAMVINHINEAGEFLGGAILPGPHLMAQSLATGTAKLPLVDFKENLSGFAGKDTAEAIRNGIYFAAVGACNCARVVYLRDTPRDDRRVIVTGGDAGLLADKLLHPMVHDPLLTLEGIRIAAEALP